MFPLRDDIASESLPVVCWLLIGANAAAFFFELSLGSDIQGLIRDYGMIPARFWSGEQGQFLTLVSSMFLHGGWGHLFGNMLYLWIFGDNVEDRMGHLPFLFFYLACGLAAGLTHVATNPGSSIPTVGASGAIAGVLGAYLVLFPRARVLTLLPFFPITTTYIPAVFFLGIWFVMQIFSGAMQLSVARDAGGVAFLAHVGGFVAGALLGGVARLARPGPERGPR